jgi:predicted Zn-dependent protease
MDQGRIQNVFRQVAAAAGTSTPLVVVDNSRPSAWTDGDSVFITKALITKLPEREIAAVLGHELGHVVERHIETTKVERNRLRQHLTSSFKNDSLAGAVAAAVVEVALLGASSQRSHVLEHRADAHGEAYASRTGYRPGTMADALRRHPEGTSFTHPSTSKREEFLADKSRKLRIRIRRRK